jgi:hypothetical protein
VLDRFNFQVGPLFGCIILSFHELPENMFFGCGGTMCINFLGSNCFYFLEFFFSGYDELS